MLLCAETLEGNHMASTLVPNTTVLRSDMKRPKFECDLRKDEGFIVLLFAGTLLGNQLVSTFKKSKALTDD